MNNLPNEGVHIIGFSLYSDLPNNRAAHFIPIIGIKFAERLFGRSEYVVCC